MEINPGYRHSEMGVIPDEWEIISLGRLSAFITSGSRGWARYYSDDGALFIRSQNVRDGRLDFTETQFVNSPQGSEGSRTRVKRSDLLITITGNSVGNVALVEQELGEAYISQHVGLVRLFAPSSGQYVSRFLSPGSPGNGQIWASQSGQSKPGLTLKNLQDFWIALPPLPEQRAIVMALSDADALIESLEQLIAKKRRLKQGAMQKLFSGQKRLTGFGERWDLRRLGDLGSTFGGLSGKIKSDFGSGTSSYITFMNIMTNVVIDCSTFEQVNVSPTESQNRVAKGDLFFNGSSETPEEVGMCAVLTENLSDVYLNSFCFGFRFREAAKADGLYFAYYFRSSQGRELLKSLAQGATRYNLSKTALLKVTFPLPLIPEQTAIAAVLSDMDAEIATLETKLAKARQLKQGMMQELLTGRTRLI